LHADGVLAEDEADLRCVLLEDGERDVRERDETRLALRERVATLVDLRVDAEVRPAAHPVHAGSDAIDGARAKARLEGEPHPVTEDERVLRELRVRVVATTAAMPILGELVDDREGGDLIEVDGSFALRADTRAEVLRAVLATRGRRRDVLARRGRAPLEEVHEHAVLLLDRLLRDLTHARVDEGLRSVVGGEALQR